MTQISFVLQKACGAPAPDNRSVRKKKRPQKQKTHQPVFLGGGVGTTVQLELGS
jgi:hypothetical protein